MTDELREKIARLALDFAAENGERLFGWDESSEASRDAYRTLADAVLAAVLPTTEPQAEIDRLAAFIMDEVDGEPSQSQGAVDTAIRLIRQPTTEPAEYEQVGWHRRGRLLGYSKGCGVLTEPGWEPVYRRVPTPPEGTS